MSLWQVLVVAARRWYLLVPSVVLAFVLGVVVYDQVAPTYSMSADLLLLPSPTSAGTSTGPTAGPGNPYLDLIVGLSQTGQVIAVAAMDQSAVRHLAAQGFEGSYTVSQNSSLNAPVVSIIANGRTPAMAAKGRQLVVNEFENQLARAQIAAGAPKATLITPSLLTQSAQAVPIQKTRIRDALSVTIAALLVCILLVALVERRSRRGDAQLAAQPADDADESRPRLREPKELGEPSEPTDAPMDAEVPEGAFGSVRS